MKQLDAEDKAIYEWQMWTSDFGEEGQEKLKNASALVSRCGGLGGPLTQSLACAGFGKIVIAHGGDLKHSDLNRQILMSYDGLGTPRVDLTARRLKEYNPRIEVEAIPENITEENAAELVSKVDIVFDCAPLFSERFLMNRECVRQRKPMIECAMFDMEGQVTTIIPGQTPCLACVFPEDPPAWKREFPVFGAVSALAAAIGATEGIKVLGGFGDTLAGQMLYYDTRDMSFRRIPLMRRPDCPVCGSL